MKHDGEDSMFGGAQSVDRALGLLSLIGQHSARGIALSTLVAETGLNKATVRRLILALIRARLVEQSQATRVYHLGEEAYLLGMLAQDRHGLLAQTIDSLQRLARATGDAAFLSVRRGRYSVCLHREEGTHPIRTYALMPGAHHPLGVGAGSLAMLAALPEAEAEEVIASHHDELISNYPRLTPDTLHAQMLLTRKSGIALNPGLIFEDSWGLGIALRGQQGQLVGAVSLAAVESRMKEPRRSELAQKLQTEARLIEARLATSGKPTEGTAE
ncbi:MULTISPECIES: IclR family transcriptional regulator [unclassified Yoonia]|uniref:IclR family transcriptional regulator n=1 Tax=unclassified Yoonia TaxID=2629118 RepID=UPI002AFE8022|nr:MULTISPECIES: IclR family transcriptional regulator [unclassified Yoonia]